ncbi:MAG: hypothetical protein ACJ71Z_06550 [Aeromicrobium sp.]
MTVEVFLLAATTCIAVVAVVVAVAAVRAVGRLATQVAAAESAPVAKPALPDPAEPDLSEPVPVAQPLELEPRVVWGRVIVPPTQAQVVRTALGRPGVRLSVLAHGLRHALRAENRDRMVALMRREYRHRRRERLSAGRQAIRMARPTSAPSTDRLHDHLLEQRPASLTDRMIGS